MVIALERERVPVSRDTCRLSAFSSSQRPSLTCAGRLPFVPFAAAAVLLFDLVVPRALGLGHAQHRDLMTDRQKSHSP